MHLLTAIISEGGVLPEKELYYHVFANLVVSQDFFIDIQA